MNFLSLAILSVLCALCQAISLSTIAAVSMTLISFNKPAAGFFGVFRRRKPPVLETVAPSEPQNFNFLGQQAMSGGLFNPFGGFGGGNMFFPGFNAPSFGIFGQNRFPTQFRPTQQVKPQQPQFPPQQGFQSQQPQFPPQQGFQPQQPHIQGFQPQQPSMQQFPQSIQESDFDDMREPRGDEVPGMNTEEAESFFTLLAETDESKCISRLVCEMGANPQSGGEFGQTIVEIIGSLNDFPDGSKVSEYNEVLNLGVAEGMSSCRSKFTICDEESFQMVKKAQVDDDGQSS